MKCPICNYEAEDYKFCPECGCNLKEQEIDSKASVSGDSEFDTIQENDNVVNFCKKCGFELTENVEVCPQCGSSVIEKTNNFVDTLNKPISFKPFFLFVFTFIRKNRVFILGLFAIVMIIIAITMPIKNSISKRKEIAERESIIEAENESRIAESIKQENASYISIDRFLVDKEINGYNAQQEYNGNYYIFYIVPSKIDTNGRLECRVSGNEAFNGTYLYGINVSFQDSTVLSLLKTDAKYKISGKISMVSGEKYFIITDAMLVLY